MTEKPVTGSYPPIQARFAGLVGSIPVGLAVGDSINHTISRNEQGQVMALAILAIVPFLLALVPAAAEGRLVALTWAIPLGLVSGVISARGLGLLVILLLPLAPLIIGLALILGLSALASSHHRAKDGSLALAILGLSPAVSCLVVFLVDYAIAWLLGLPWGRAGAEPRPMMVFAVAVAFAGLASLVVVLSTLRRQPAVPSKPETSLKWDEFDRD